MTKVLVTGGAGFIGSHLVERLVAEGLAVTVLDNLSAGHLENLDQVRSKIEFVRGDICDRQAVMHLADGCSAIFHMAAVANVAQSLSEPLFVHEVNATGTLNICEAARASRAKVVFCSSAAIYGEQQTMPVVESALPGPISLYGAQKLMGEHYLRIYADLFSVPAVALRYFNVFGPRQDPSSPYSGVISVFVDRLKAGLGLTVFGDGLQYRDFVYVSDVVEANWLAFSRHLSGFAAYNVGRGERTDLLALAAAVGAAVGADAVVEHAPPREGDIRESVSDPSLILDSLGWKAAVSVADGLRQTVS